MAHYINICQQREHNVKCTMEAMTKHCYTQTTRETFITMNIRMCRDCHIQAIFSATKAKAKAYNTCIAPQVAYRNGKGAGHDTEKAGVVPIGRRLSLRPQADL